MLLLVFKVIKNLKQKEQTDSSQEEFVNQEYAKNRRLILYVMAIVYIVIILLVFTLWPPKQDPVLGTTLVILFHFIASWRIVGPTELGAVLLLGRPMYPVKSGLVFVLWILSRLIKESRLVIEHEIPAEPEKIWRAKRGEPDVIPKELVELGYKPAIRVTFTTEKESGTGERESADPLKERLTAEVPGIVRWKIVDFMVFLTTIESRDDAHKQMEDVYVSLITRELSKVSLENAIENRGTYDEKIEKALKEVTANWGVSIETAMVKGILLSHELNTKVQLMAEAVAEKRTSLLQGQGQGAKEKAILDGRTDGLTRMVKELGISPEAILSAETARDVAGKVDTLVAVGNGGMADLMGIVAAGAQVLKTSSKKEGSIPVKEGGAT